MLLAKTFRKLNLSDQALATLEKFETALNRMKSAYQALRTSVGKIEEAAERFPGH